MLDQIAIGQAKKAYRRRDRQHHHPGQVLRKMRIDSPDYGKQEWVKRRVLGLCRLVGQADDSIAFSRCQCFSGCHVDAVIVVCAECVRTNRSHIKQRRAQ